MIEEILADAAESKIPADYSISKIARLADTQSRLERQLSQAEKDVSDIKEHLREVSERLLPEAMLEAGVTSFSLSSGDKITVRPFYGASITDENRGDCYAWLEGRGHGSLIKRVISVSMPRGDQELSCQTQETLRALGLSPNAKESIHPQTLQAFVKEQIESGADFPQDLFKVFAGKKAIIKGSV